jgi:glycosyltransferase involved in cell wall biosynthesis
MTTKILYVITKSNWGGAQRYVYELATEAATQGYEVSVAVGEPGVLTENLHKAGIHTISFGLKQHRTFLGDLFSFGSVFSLIRLFKTERPDIVHVNSAKAGGLGGFAARIAQVPLIIFTAHGWEFNAPRSFFSKIGIRFFSWLTILLAHRTIAVSRAIEHDVRRLPGVKSRITVIRHGITCPTLSTREEARALLSPHTIGQYWIGMISELNPTKRIEDALTAFSIVAKTHPEALLVILGEGRSRKNLETLVRELDIGHQVSFVGFRSDAASLLRAFDLFLHTSTSEALGYVILEAGCAELPVVATNVGGIPEIILDDNHGLLVEKKNPEALAEAIESLMQDHQRANELAARLHARVETAFGKERMIEETFALYNNKP